ncbi:MAG: septum formation protein Maf [Rhizobiales bacterium]|nr:septum formation protein Maf [Hyphomicrobiales bacterium]
MSLWLAREPLVLASKSAVRRVIVENAGIPVAVHPADIDERMLESRMKSAGPREVAQALALAKAQAVSAMLPGRLVLGADQTLALGDTVFYKPADKDAARSQLQTLRGATHTLHAGIALVEDGAEVFAHTAVAQLTMRQFSDDFLEAYLSAAGDAVLHSVGAYQIEGAGIHLFDRIDGDQFTIMGLPLLPLLNFLRGWGYLAA